MGHWKQLIEIILNNLKSFNKDRFYLDVLNWLVIVGFLAIHTVMQFDIREGEYLIDKNLIIYFYDL